MVAVDLLPGRSICDAPPLETAGGKLTKTLYKSKSKNIGVFSAAMLGVGSMVGAGIFALLGEAASTAGSAVWISFLLSGTIALLSAYSLGRLGARYPAAGGLAEYLVQGWGKGVFAGSLNVLLYLSGIIGMALVARAFGSYGSAWIPSEYRDVAEPTMAVAIVLVLMLVNLEGARSVARLENGIVGLKFIILVAFGIIGLSTAKAELLSPESWPPTSDVLSTIGLTFFAFSGYSVITNTAEDMADPKRMLPRSMILAVLMVLGLYLLVSVAALGSLPPATIISSKDYVLAEAARPILGSVGFVIMTFTALVSTASSLNANLYSVTNIGYQMAKDGELPSEFGQPVEHSREGLLFSSVAVAVLAATLDLGAIAASGAIVVLLVQSAVHMGHLRVRRETGAPLPLVAMALLGTLGAAIYVVYEQISHTPDNIEIVGAALLIASAVEAVMRKRRKEINAVIG